MGLHTCTAVARSLCVSWAFLYTLLVYVEMHRTRKTGRNARRGCGRWPPPCHGFGISNALRNTTRYAYSFGSVMSRSSAVNIKSRMKSDHPHIITTACSNSSVSTRQYEPILNISTWYDFWWNVWSSLVESKTLTRAQLSQGEADRTGRYLLLVYCLSPYAWHCI